MAFSHEVDPSVLYIGLAYSMLEGMRVDIHLFHREPLFVKRIISEI